MQTAQFLSRVELHRAKEDYDILHEAMKQCDFSRTVLSTKHIEYHLPPAEYILDGEVTSDDVCRRAIKASLQTGKKFAVLVTEVK